MSYGFLNLKPDEFWSLQPKDVLILNEGFEQRREYEFEMHVQTLRCIRTAAYMVYISIPGKKGTKKVDMEKFLPLPLDKVRQRTEPMTEEQFRKTEELYNKKFKK